MSKLRCYASELATQEEYEIINKFIKQIECFGNDEIFINCDIRIPKRVMELILDIHLIDANKLIEFSETYRGE